MVYFDDVWDESHSPWAGELLAIREFNQSKTLRKIEPYRFLRSRRVFKNARWIDQIYALHLFDLPYPNASKIREQRILDDYYSHNGPMSMDHHCPLLLACVSRSVRSVICSGVAAR